MPGIPCPRTFSGDWRSQLKESPLACLSHEQQNTLAVLRQQLEREGAWDSSKHDLYALRRFIKARNWDTNAARQMWLDALAFRKEHRIDHILEEFKFTEREAFLKAYPHGLHKVDRTGQPVLVYKLGSTDLDALRSVTTDERMKLYHIQEYERMMKFVFPACSLLAGRHVEKLVTIIDVGGLRMKDMMRVKDILGMYIKVDSNNYPETLAAMCIINAPYWFAGMFSAIKTFLNAETQKKIQIIGSNYKQTLQQLIAPECLLSDFGGTSTGALGDNIGPWQQLLEQLAQRQQQQQQEAALLQEEQRLAAAAAAAMATQQAAVAAAAMAAGAAANLPVECASIETTAATLTDGTATVEVVNSCSTVCMSEKEHMRLLQQQQVSPTGTAQPADAAAHHPLELPPMPSTSPHVAAASPIQSPGVAAAAATAVLEASTSVRSLDEVDSMTAAAAVALTAEACALSPATAGPAGRPGAASVAELYQSAANGASWVAAAASIDSSVQFHSVVDGASWQHSSSLRATGSVGMPGPSISAQQHAATLLRGTRSLGASGASAAAAAVSNTSAEWTDDLQVDRNSHLSFHSCLSDHSTASAPQGAGAAHDRWRSGSLQRQQANSGGGMSLGRPSSTPPGRRGTHADESVDEMAAAGASRVGTGSSSGGGGAPATAAAVPELQPESPFIVEPELQEEPRSFWGGLRKPGAWYMSKGVARRYTHLQESGSKQGGNSGKSSGSGGRTPTAAGRLFGGQQQQQQGGAAGRDWEWDESPPHSDQAGWGRNSGGPSSRKPAGQEAQSGSSIVSPPLQRGRRSASRQQLLDAESYSSTSGPAAGNSSYNAMAGTPSKQPHHGQYRYAYDDGAEDEYDLSEEGLAGSRLLSTGRRRSGGRRIREIFSSGAFSGKGCCSIM